LPYLDFAEIKRTTTFADAVSLLGLTLKQHSNQWRGACPACQSGGDRALVITEGKGFYCFAAQKGGDQIALVAHIRDIPVKEAAELLVNTPERKGTSTAEPVTGIVPGLKPLDLDHEHDAVVALGFDPADAQQLGIGYAGKGIMRGLVAIPIRLPSGELAGYVGVTDIAKLPPRWHGINSVVPFPKKTA
jgi:hypothetical protein